MSHLVIDTLEAHNEVRQAEGKPPLNWCQECAQSAQEHADRLARSGEILHGNLCDGHSHMGQNIAVGGKAFNVKKAVDSWVQEKISYNDRGKQCGHYTQVVWRGTTHVGVGVARMGNKTILVANYHPPGNMPSQFAKNV